MVDTVSGATEYTNTQAKLKKGRRLLNLIVAKGGVHFQDIVDRSMPDGCTIVQAIDAWRAEGPVVAALRAPGGVLVPKQELMEALGFFVHLYQGMHQTSDLLAES